MSRMLRKRNAWMLGTCLLLALFGLLACGAAGDETKGVSVGKSFNDPNLDINNTTTGGFSSSDESLTLADLETTYGLAGESEVETDAFSFLNPLAGDETGVEPSARPDEAAPPDKETPANTNAEAYYLRLIWGQLRFNPKVAQATTWDGSLFAEADHVRILRAILFEDPTDGIVKPQPAENEVAWKSTTKPHHDGFLVGIRGLKPAAGETVSKLTFNTKPFEFEGSISSTTVPAFDIGALKPYGYHKVDDTGNMVAGIGFRHEPRGCANGYLEGLFKRENDKGGVFVGRWHAVDHRVTGILKGIWGVDAKGKKVLYGKYMDAYGHFRGRLVGTYAEGQDGLGGTLEAVWFNKASRAAGGVVGVYLLGDGQEGQGAFQAVWTFACKRMDAGN